MNDLDLRILTLEREAHLRPSSKANRIMDLDLTETAYYRRLNQLLDEPAALAAEPVTINRLRRMRERRRRWSQAVA